MRCAALVVLAVAAAPGAGGCEASRAVAGALAAAGRPSLRLVAAPAGARLAAAGERLLEAHAEALHTPLPGATPVRDGAPLAESPRGHTFLVVSEEPELALRLAARLAREGAAQVAVVADGRPAWRPALERSQPGEE
jgi:hypothetical protein